MFGQEKRAIEDFQNYYNEVTLKLTQLKDMVKDYDQATKFGNFVLDDYEKICKKIKDLLSMMEKNIPQTRYSYLSFRVKKISEASSGLFDLKIFKENKFKDYTNSISESKKFQDAYQIPNYNYYDTYAILLTNLVTENLGLISLVLAGLYDSLNSYEEAMQKWPEEIGYFLEESSKMLEAPLDTNWLISNTYLCALDIFVNQKCIKHGISVQETDGKWRRIEDKISNLEDKAKSEGLQIDFGTIKESSSGLWETRSKQIVHNGYLPDDSQTELIVKGVNRIIKILSKM